MKKIFFPLAALACLISTIACDEIDEADRIVEGETMGFIFNPDTVPYTIDGHHFNIIKQHVLLVEDYTGWKCVNCPDIATFIERDIMSNYPAITVGLHPASNSLSNTPAGLPFQLSTTLADEYANTFSTNANAASMSLPAISIDRISTDGNRLFSSDTTTLFNTVNTLTFDQYFTYNVQSPEEQIYLGLNIQPTSGNHIDSVVYNVCTAIVAETDVHKNIKLQLWLTENHISGMQFKHNGVADYEHNHVLKQAINGTWGETIATESNETMVAHQVTLPIDKAANYEVVGFVYDADTYEVLNAIKGGIATP